MKLTKLTLHQYRDLAPGTSFTFSPTLNLVLGDNGTGRTTLLELLAAVLSSDFSGLIREAFSLEYALSFPGMALNVRVRNLPRAPTTEPAAAPDALARPPAELTPGLEPFIEASLTLEAPTSHVVMRADASGLGCDVDGHKAWSRTLQWSVLDRSVWTLLFMVAQYLPAQVKDRLKELLRRTFLLAPSRFDEGLGMFERLGTITYAMETRGEDLFPLGLMALPTWMPGWLREQAARGLPEGALEFRHDAIPRNFLERFVTLAGLAAGTLRVEVLERRAFENGGRLAFGRFGFHFTRHDGSGLTEAQLGHGQKRLLAFLYYLDVNEDFVIADELACGLHPRQVEACVRELGARQTFVTSQCPVLAEHLEFGSAEDVRAALILCGTERRAGAERRTWAHPEREAAERLFAAYREKRQPLGTLLRAQGFW
ncbi:AAA family ATPase [Myxococcaceae bacterium GXIMD 01537]